MSRLRQTSTSARRPRRIRWRAHGESSRRRPTSARTDGRRPPRPAPSLRDPRSASMAARRSTSRPGADLIFQGHGHRAPPRTRARRGGPASPTHRAAAVRLIEGGHPDGGGAARGEQGAGSVAGGEQHRAAPHACGPATSTGELPRSNPGIVSPRRSPASRGSPPVDAACTLPRLGRIGHGNERATAVCEGGHDRGARPQHVDDEDGRSDHRHRRPGARRSGRRRRAPVGPFRASGGRAERGCAVAVRSG